MCGIAGIINLNKNSDPINPSNGSLFQSMLFSRGPDASGLWHSQDKNILLVVQRLATKDKRTIANQPCWSTDKKIISIFNGEIYNHKELRDKLILCGYKFYSMNDTEVIANAYHYWGEKFLQKLKGQFALAVFDKEKSNFILARDEHGISPLYYSKIGEKLYFSSTPDSIFMQSNKKLLVNEQAVSDFIVADCIPNGNTFYKNIKYIESGNYFLINYKKKIFKKRKFFSYKKYKKIKKGTHDKKYYIEKIYEILANGVEKRFEGDKNVGVFLSSGLDSSLVLGLIRQIYPKKKINTFTASFKYSDSKDLIGEHKNSKKIANYFNAENTIVPIEPKQLLKSIGTFSQPSAGLIEPIYKSLSIQAKKNNTEVILTGEGADEIFIGYDHNLALISKFNKNFLYLGEKFKFRSNFKEKTSNQIKIENYFLGGGADIDIDNNRNNIFNRLKYNTSPYKKNIKKLLSELNISKNSEVEKIAFLIDFSIKVPEYFLRRSEEPTMNEGVELRFPFLQNELKELVYGIPLEIKLGNKIESKHLLREVAKKILPKKLLFEKLPIGVPAVRKEYFKNSSHKFNKPAFKDFFHINYKEMKDTILDGRYKKLELFDEEYLFKIIKQQSNKKNCFFDKMLWKIWNIAAWYERQT